MTKEPTYCEMCHGVDDDELELHEGCKCCGNNGYFDPPIQKEMYTEEFLKIALNILHDLALENRNKGLFKLNRWYIPDEPLRNDAARLLRRINYKRKKPYDTKYVGD